MRCDPSVFIQEMEITEDLAQIEEIWLNGAKKAHSPRIPEAFWDQRISALVAEAQDAGERYVCKGEGNQVRGFLLANPRANGTCYVLEAYVDQLFQRQGIATALLDTLRGRNPRFPQLKERYGVVTSSVYVHNDPSVAWHIKNEFKIRGVMFCCHTGLPKLEMMWTRDKGED